ncbi:PREDICTED: uncharacterized protein LOC108559541 [Nicrophorus vespilloides]|uniref:Uncharacterized protein LOC108559541 n=1 Tax=Nicrophorus vespilloides TaxID=110193 RepID=A0ABM1MCP5_NICVS|nr:PREDICTED: uncharacterized protein LOC108559541 [Nicrophorus vespilloides]
MLQCARNLQQLKMFKTLLVLSCCVAVCLCAVAIEPPNPNAAKGTCVSKQWNLTLKSGESKQVPKECAQLTCQSNGSIQYTSCGVAVNSKGERCSEDLSKPYPDCCPTC